MSSAAEELAMLNASAATDTGTLRLRFFAAGRRGRSGRPDSTTISGIAGFRSIASTVGSWPPSMNPPEGGMTGRSPLCRAGSQATGCSVAAIVLFTYLGWDQNFLSSLLSV